jgi:cation diffusion facilitator CzcD-associated flavoprotein CzcO
MRPMQFTGRGGLAIEEAWREKLSAYCSMCIPGFPNFFLMLGPNSPIGNQSVIEISETQVAWALQLVERWRGGAVDCIEVRPEALARWRAMIKQKMSHTVWVSGCNSWYLDADGDAIAWPDSWKRWQRMMRRPLLEDFLP